MDEEHRVRATRIHSTGGTYRLPGWLAVFLGLFGSLAMATAIAVGTLMVFASSLFWAALLWTAWPFVFAPEASVSVFADAGRPQYWKLFVLLAVFQAMVKTSTKPSPRA